MVDLAVELAGIRLKNPIIAAAGPNTKNLSVVVDCIKAGFGAVVVRSLHMQYPDQIGVPMREFWRIYSRSKHFNKEFYALQSTGAPAKRPNEKVPPGFGGAAPMPSLYEWAEEVRKMVRVAKEHDCALIASLGWCGSNLSTEEVWRSEARAMADAGVDAIQLHTAPSPATEPGRHHGLHFAGEPRL